MKELGVHTAVETCLFVPEENVRLAIDHIDFFYADVKILDRNKAKEVEHGNLELYLNNLDKVLTSGKPVVIRIPVIGGYTDGEENRTLVYDLLEKYKSRILKIELIKEHNLGESKYRSLNMQLPAYNGVPVDLMEQYRQELVSPGSGFAEGAVFLEQMTTIDKKQLRNLVGRITDKAALRHLNEAVIEHLELRDSRQEGGQDGYQEGSQDSCQNSYQNSHQDSHRDVRPELQFSQQHTFDSQEVLQ